MRDSVKDTKYDTLRVLISRFRDGVITQEEVIQMEDILRSGPEARNYYKLYLSLCCDLEGVLNVLPPPAYAELNDPVLSEEFWSILAEEEKKAPSTDVLAPIDYDDRERIHKTRYLRVPQTINRFSHYFALLSMAAIVALIVYINFSPAKKANTTACAVLVDTIDARWKEGTRKIGIGENFYDYQDGYHLVSGVIKMRFDYGAEVIIEGESSFSCLTSESVRLACGKLHAYVPSQMTGFSVDTPSSKIIDLGTEFGIHVNTEGSAEIHMLDGKAAIIPGLKGHKGPPVNLTANQATRVDTTGKMQTIRFHGSQFIRQISSESRFIWRGEASIPTDGLIIHMKADSLWLQDGESVAKWPDSAKSDRVDGTLSAMPGYGMPVFKANACNGMPAVRFIQPQDPNNAPPQQKQVLASDTWRWNEKAGVTIFIFCTGGIAERPQRVVQVGRTGGAMFQSFGCDVSSNESGTRDNNGFCLTDSPFEYGEWHISVRQLNQGSSYGDVFYSVDGVPLKMLTNRSENNIDFVANKNDITVGAGAHPSFGMINWYDGDVAEILVYNKQLSMAEIDIVMSYLNSKYDHGFHD